MRSILICILFFFGVSVSQSQETVVLLGSVLNDTIDVSALTVVNISLRRGTITNQKGVFEIPIRLNDTLNISAVQYESRQLLVTETIFNRRKISLYLMPKINELEEVTISNIDLSGDLSKDIGGVVFKTYIDPRDLGIPLNRQPTRSPEERRYDSATGGAGAVGMLLNAISGRTKMLKQHLEIAKLRGLVAQKREKYADSVYMQSLNIPPELIEDFVYYIFEDKKAIRLVDARNSLELLDHMMVQAPVYLELKKAGGSMTIKNIDDE